MPSCEKCFLKAEAVHELGDPREKAPLLILIGSSAAGDVWVCPVCGDVVTRPKKGSPDEQSPPPVGDEESLG